MVQSHIIGLPRVGKYRELKFALESYWKGNSTEQELREVSQTIRQNNYQWQKDSNMDYITVGDFSFYDHILDVSLLFNIIPSRHQKVLSNPQSWLDKMFLIARGRNVSGDEESAGELTKWFDTNYHYIVPEFEDNLKIELNCDFLLEQINEAKAYGKVKVALTGILTYLWLGKTKGGFDNKLELFEQFKPHYQQLIDQVTKAGAEVVQIDEPCLVQELPKEWIKEAQNFYNQLNFGSAKSLLTSSYEQPDISLQEYFSFNFNGFHIDCSISQPSLKDVTNNLPENKFLSLGFISGRNIWKSDLSKVIEHTKEFADSLGSSLWVSTSCSLLHCPIDLDLEENLNAEVKNWLAFTKQKLFEISAVKAVLNHSNTSQTDDYLQQNQEAINQRKTSALTNNNAVKNRLKNISHSDITRDNEFPVRINKQQENFNLPLLPTTTIGSFPQTKEIRQARQQYKNNLISSEQYAQSMKEEISQNIIKQEKIGIDVLVHGEPERNDMVEYFGEQLEGYLASTYGWVQSYGSRCVKPPIIYGDVERTHAMTIDWITYAQSLTDKKVKGMLTGPVTMLQWSFVRDDQPREVTCKQIALAILDEVQDLEKNGIDIIQVDEPALREGLPLRQDKQQEYLKWATDAFKLATSNVEDTTQIHTHMCYCEFNDIMDHIIALDADVISIETSRSQMELLEVFQTHHYPNQIGPGVYDIHSPRIADVDEMKNLLQKATNNIDIANLWVNPDCGLKTRDWKETEISLENMVKASLSLREQIQ